MAESVKALTATVLERVKAGSTFDDAVAAAGLEAPDRISVLQAALNAVLANPEMTHKAACKELGLEWDDTRRELERNGFSLGRQWARRWKGARA